MKTPSSATKWSQISQVAWYAGMMLLAALVPAAASAGSWPPDGKAIAEHGISSTIPSCASCHGNDFRGEAKTGAPSLRGKAAADLMDKLYNMTGNSKDHSKMAQIARHLDMSQRAAVTAYIASLPSGSD